MDAARRLPLLALGLLAALAERAEAAGFALKEQSGEGQGASFAGASAGYGGLGVMFFNPAVQGLADGVRVDSTRAPGSAWTARRPRPCWARRSPGPPAPTMSASTR
jgi:hypothetical protein